MNAKGENQGPSGVDLSVIIPVYNEQDSLPPLADRLRSVLNSLEMESEIIFVDDGSVDSSLEVLRSLKAGMFPGMRILVFAENRGQSAAFAAAFRVAKGRIIATLDADLQNDPADIPSLLEKLNEYDMVCGWRKNRQDPWIRRISTRISNWVRRQVLRDGFHDTACSLRVLRKECIQDLVLFNGMHRFLPMLVKMAGYRVGEVIVNHRERLYGEAKYNIRNRLFRALTDLFGVLWLRSRLIRYQIKGEE